MKSNLTCMVLLVFLCSFAQAEPEIPDAINSGNPQAEAADLHLQQTMLEQARAFKQSHPELFGEVKGVLIMTIVPGGQGEKTGLKQGDILLTYDNTPLNSSEHLIELTGTKDENETVTLTYLRNRELHNADLKGGRIGVQIVSLSPSQAELSMEQMQFLIEKGIKTFNQSRLKEAMQQFQQGLEIASAQKKQDWQSSFLNKLGHVYHRLGQYPQALAHYQQSLAIIEQLVGESHPDTAQILINYAELHHALNQTTRAIFYGKRAINVLQASRESNQQLSEELRKSFLTSKESSYRIVANWLLEAGRLAEAEQVLAMLKEEEQYQYLRRSPSAAKVLTTRTTCTRWEEEHCQHYQQISIALREAGKSLQETEKQVHAGEEIEQARLNELQQLLKTRKTAFDEGLARINTALSALQGDPEYKLHVEKDVSQRINRLHRSLKELGHGAVTLHYLLMEDGVRIILTTPEKQLVHNSKIKLTVLRHKVGMMRQAILRQEAQADLKALSWELYSLLIAPVAEELAAAKAQTLMTSLDGILRYLPFAALYDGKQFLIERYAISFQTLAARTDLNIQPQATWQVTGFGVSQAADVVDPITLQPIRFDPLPYVTTELKTLIRQNDKEEGLLPGEIYLDDKFNKKQLTTTLKRERPNPVIHIGSHFALRPGDNSRSFLLLGQNTILTMSEVYEENLDFSGADLVTLSACDTAMGEDNALSNGAEIESFGVLVQELGAKSVMATLWPVIDESTSLFMQRFYQLREQNKLTKAEALRQAQLSMIGSGNEFAQPYYWAPFVLMGNWL